jgi:hypothetical protein
MVQYFIILFLEGFFVDVRVGDILEMKKQHPCGTKQFYVLRSGMDFRLRCCGCEREFLIPRVKAEKNIKKIIRENTDD